MSKTIDNNGSKKTLNDKQTNNSKSKATFQLEDSLHVIEYITIIGISILVYVLSAKVLLSVYKPDIQKALSFASENLCVGGYAPEPMEKALYFLGLLIFPATIFLLVLLFKPLKQKLVESTVKPLFWTLLSVSIIAVIFFIYVAFNAQNPYFGQMQNWQDAMKSNWDFYFSSTFLYSNLYLFSFIIFPVLLFLFYRAQIKKNVLLDKVSLYTTFLFCGIIILIVFFITAFSFPYTFENKYDLNAVLYSVIQVFHGAPMLVDSFTNTYGLYPHFIVPFLKIFGMSIHSFTIIMAFLLAACFVFLLIVLNKHISNKWLVLFGFTSVFFNCYMYFRIATPYDNVFSMSPIRWILLFSLLFTASLYVSRKSKIVYYVSFLLFSIGILWNPEFGIICYACLVAFYCFLSLEKNDWKTIITEWIKHLLLAIGAIAISFGMYELLIKIFYGQFPNLLQMFSTIQVFSSIGMGMLAMSKTYHPYMLVALVYLFGLLYSIKNIIDKNIDGKTALIFLLTCLGLLFFVYFIGRSHNWNLFISNPMAFILLSIFADDFLKKISVNKAFIAIFGVVLFSISFSFFQTVCESKRISNLIYETDNKVTNRDDNEIVKANASYIQEKTRKGEKVIIFTATHKQGLYHCLSNTASAFNPGFVELFLKTDYSRLLNTLQNDSAKVFLEPNQFRFADLQMVPIMAANYEYKECNGALYYFEKRKENPTLKPLLQSSKNAVLHKVLNANLHEKTAYAQGKNGSITLGNQFTLEIVMKPKTIPQSVYTQMAGVLSNISQDKGFIFRQNDTIQNQFIFGFSNQGIICQTQMNAWNYIVFKVDNNKISCFMNNMPAGTVETKSAYQNTTDPLFIGDLNGNPGFFFGDIQEVKFSNGLIDANEIAESWNRVQAFAAKK